jgi:hypothetical protein
MKWVIEPIGQNQPQKNLPNAMVRKTTIREMRRVLFKEWVERRVLRRTSGSILKKMSRGKEISSFSG